MNEATTSPVSVSGRPKWTRGLRWFAAEFLVVVSGVLVALALQSWYQARQDRSAEALYLHQLTADLDTTERMLQHAITSDSTHLEANGRLVAELYDTKPLSAEVARHWLSLPLGSYSDPRPVLGTVSTLVETGDIRLVRDPALRSQIVAYLGSMLTDSDELNRNINRLIEANDTERSHLERIGIVPPGVSGEDSSTYVQRYLREWPSLRGDAGIRAAYQTRLRATANRLAYLRRMLERTKNLRELITEP